MEYKYQAIILGKHNVGETDRVYTLYTKEAGKIRLVAHGVRKPQAKLAPHLETATYSEIFLAKSRGRGRITGAVPVEVFPSVKSDIDLAEKVFWALQIFDRMVTQEEKDEKVFELLLGYLRQAEGATNEEAEILTHGFVFKFFHSLGYGLEMGRCVSCGRRLLAGSNFFDAERGGVVCSECVSRTRRKVRITDESIKLIRIFINNKIENLGKVKAAPGMLSNLKLIAAEASRWIAG